jgi:hypothetical protein
MVVDFVPFELLFEMAQLGVLVDKQELEVSHVGEILQVLCGQSLAETGMVCSTSQDPGCGSDL